MLRKYKISQLLLLTTLLIICDACEPRTEGYCPQPISTCPEMKDWLKSHKNEIPICGVIWLKQIGDQRQALQENCSGKSN